MVERAIQADLLRGKGFQARTKISIEGSKQWHE
jgi:hypothetical protein